MSAEADAACGAAYCERTNTRDGYRRRGWDTGGREHWPGDPAAAPGQLLTGLAAGAPPAEIQNEQYVCDNTRPSRIQR